MTSRAGSPSAAARAQRAGGEREHLGGGARQRGRAVGERLDGARRKLGVGVGLHVELEHEIARRRGQQVLDEERRLAAAKAARAAARRPCARAPALEVRAERQPRVVQQHELAVRGQHTSLSSPSASAASAPASAVRGLSGP